MDNQIKNQKPVYRSPVKKTKMDLSIEQLSQICIELDEIKKINEQIIKVPSQ